MSVDNTQVHFAKVETSKYVTCITLVGAVDVAVVTITGSGFLAVGTRVIGDVHQLFSCAFGTAIMA